MSIGFARHIKSYDTKPWAYFSFISEEAKQAAMEISCSFNGKLLQWIETSQAKHLCVRCSSMEHITKDCDALKSRGRNPTPKSIQNLYDKFHLTNTTIKKPKPSKRDNINDRDNGIEQDPSSRSRFRSRSRSRSSSSRPRSSSRRRHEEDTQTTNSSSSSQPEKKQVTYADAASNASRTDSLDNSIHSPVNNTNSVNNKKSENNKHKGNHLDASTIDKLTSMVRNTITQFNTLKNEFISWKEQIENLDSRISNIEKHCNISNSTSSKNNTTKPHNSTTNSSKVSDKRPSTRNTTTQVAQPSSSKSTVDPNRIDQFEGNLSAMGNQLNEIAAILNSIVNPQHSPATSQQPHHQ